MKIGIIGMGRVGTSVARSLLLNDVHLDVAEGEALDLAHGGAFYPTATVRTAAVEDLIECDAVVIAAGRNGRSDESRLALLRDNARMVVELARQLARLRGLLVIVSNPVDVLTQLAAES